MSANDPFGGMPFFGDIAKLLGQQGPVAWEPATQLAVAIATDGTPDANIDPIERIRFEQLARIAEVQVNGVTGLDVSIGGHITTIEPVNRTQWVTRTIDAFRDRFEAFATVIGTDEQPTGTPQRPTGHGSDPDRPRVEPPVPGLEDLADLGGELSQFDHPSTLGGDAATPVGFGDVDPEEPESWLTGMLAMLSPMLLGMTAGSLVGHLSRRSFGVYDLPLPRPLDAPLLVLPDTINDFSKEWSLDGDQLRLAVCIHELTSHAVMGIPFVRSRLEAFLSDYATGFRPDPEALERRLGDFDPTRMESLASFQQMMGDPEILVGASISPAQRALRPQIDALVATIVGYVDHVMDQIGGRLIDSHAQITEALRRQRVTESDADHFVEQLFGLELGQAVYDRGEAFISGIVERAGEDGLTRLWSSEASLPTPAEVDAPGLWLARIDLPDDA